MKEVTIQTKTQSTLIALAKKLLIAFVVLQPIFDLYMCLFDEYIQIAGTSLATVLRIGMVFIMMLLVMIATRKAKTTLCFAIYCGAILIYTVIHHFHALGFRVPLAQASYSPFAELLYLIRIFLAPALIYIIYHIKLSYQDLKKMLLIVSITISSVIIVSNLFKFGHVAYVLEKIVIKENMLSWFTGTSANWVLLTCRGLFQWTNQISAVLLITLPFLIYVCFKEKKFYLWGFLVLHILAMINLGTRIAAFGGIATLVAMLFLHILEKLIQKESFAKKSRVLFPALLSLCIVGIFLYVSPIVVRYNGTNPFEDIAGTLNQATNQNQNQNNTDPNVSQTKTPEDEDQSVDFSAKEKIEYIEENWIYAEINEIYIKEAYPYTEDCDFWYHIIKDVPLSERAGNRNMRKFLINRILERDGRFSNRIWGISYTRSSSFVWPERDIETHLDSLGIVGVALFLGPYFAALAVGIWFFFKDFKNNLRLSQSIYLISLVIGLANSYLSGHVMNEIFPFVFLALFAGIVLASTKSKKGRELLND